MTNSKKGILLVNLGSPDSCEVPDVRRYLDEFLMDGNVIDIPYPIRALIVKGFILPTRPKKSAHAYSTIWWEEGSPLIVLSKRMFEKLKPMLDAPVALGMRYGNPSIETGIRDLLRAMPDMEEMLLIPLYPQYAMASTKTVVDKVVEVMKNNNWNFRLETLKHFYNEKNYLKVLSKSIGEHWNDSFDHLLFSYHGIPERHLRKVDPTKKHCLKVTDCCNVVSEAHQYCYAHQCKETTKAVVKELGIPDGKWSWSFQSRLGSDAWLKPYTDYELPRLAASGVKKLAVVCPAFVTDCLETLEEIAIRGREDFIAAGGEEFHFIPCLNDRTDWTEVVAGYGKQFLATGKVMR